MGPSLCLRVTGTELPASYLFSLFSFLVSVEERGFLGASCLVWGGRGEACRGRDEGVPSPEGGVVRVLLCQVGIPLSSRMETRLGALCCGRGAPGWAWRSSREADFEESFLCRCLTRKASCLALLTSPSAWATAKAGYLLFLQVS